MPKVNDCTYSFKKENVSLDINFTKFAEEILESMSELEVLVPAIFFGNNLAITSDSKFKDFQQEQLNILGSTLFNRLQVITSPIVEDIYFAYKSIGDTDKNKVKNYDNSVQYSIDTFEKTTLFCDPQKLSDKTDPDSAQNFYNLSENLVNVNPQAWMEKWMPVEEPEKAEQVLTYLIAHLLIHEYTHALNRCSWDYVFDRNQYLVLNKSNTADQVMGHCMEFKRANLLIHYMFNLLKKDEFLNIEKELEYSFENILRQIAPYDYENKLIVRQVLKPSDYESEERANSELFNKFIESVELLNSKYPGVYLSLVSPKLNNRLLNQYVDTLKHLFNPDLSRISKKLNQAIDGFRNLGSLKGWPSLFQMVFIGSFGEFLDMLEYLDKKDPLRSTYKDFFSRNTIRNSPSLWNQSVEEANNLLRDFVNREFSPVALSIYYNIEEEPIDWDIYGEDLTVSIRITPLVDRSPFSYEKNSQTYNLYRGVLQGLDPITDFSQGRFDSVLDSVKQFFDSLKRFHFEDLGSSFPTMAFRQGRLSDNSLEISVDFFSDLLTKINLQIPFDLEFSMMPDKEYQLKFDGNRLSLSLNKDSYTTEIQPLLLSTTEDLLYNFFRTLPNVKPKFDVDDTSVTLLPSTVWDSFENFGFLDNDKRKVNTNFVSLWEGSIPVYVPLKYDIQEYLDNYLTPQTLIDIRKSKSLSRQLPEIIQEGNLRAMIEFGISFILVAEDLFLNLDLFTFDSTNGDFKIFRLKDSDSNKFKKVNLINEKVGFGTKTKAELLFFKKFKRLPRSNYAESNKALSSQRKKSKTRNLKTFSKFPICTYSFKDTIYTNLLEVPRVDYTSITDLISSLQEQEFTFGEIFDSSVEKALYVIQNTNTGAFEFLHYDGKFIRPVSFSYGWWILYT